MSLSRVTSASQSALDHTTGGRDPYAVPPLPHQNPNLPYRDDPTAATGYYDPYRGPIPGTLENGGSTGHEQWGAGSGMEAIPMTQLANPALGRASPAPQMAYDPTGAYGAYAAGRASPSPSAAYRIASPAPQAAYAGRASPGPGLIYGGRASPGPQAAFDAYGPR